MGSERPVGTAGAGLRSGRFAVPDRFLWLVFVVACLGLPALSLWLLHGWVQRRLDPPTDLLFPLSGMPGALIGALVVGAVAWARPSLDPEQRRRAAEAAEPGRRRYRVWLIVLLSVMELRELVFLVADAASPSPVVQDWSFVVTFSTVATCCLPDVLPSRAGLSPGTMHFDQAERCEAVRVGWLVLVVLGVVAAGAGIRWPFVAGQAWPGVLLASLLAAEIRMATLPRQVADEAA